MDFNIIQFYSSEGQQILDSLKNEPFSEEAIDQAEQHFGPEAGNMPNQSGQLLPIFQKA